MVHSTGSLELCTADLQPTFSANVLSQLRTFSQLSAHYQPSANFQTQLSANFLSQLTSLETSLGESDGSAAQDLSSTGSTIGSRFFLSRRLVDPEKCCKMHISTRKSASILQNVNQFSIIFQYTFSQLSTNFQPTFSVNLQSTFSQRSATFNSVNF